MEKENNIAGAKTVGSFKTVGDRKCCAWSVAPGVVWVQARNAKLKAKLARIDGAKLVVEDQGGGYLRTFEFQKPFSWARDWIKRNASTNGPYSRSAGPVANDNSKDESEEQQQAERAITEIGPRKLAMAA